MAPPSFFVNDVDMGEEFNLWLNTPDGWFDAPRSEDTVNVVPGQAGGIVHTSDVVVGTRDISLTGVLIADTDQDAFDLWDAAKKVLAGPELELRFGKQADRMAIARYQSMAWIRTPGTDMGAGIQLNFLMPNPFLLARTVDPYAIPTGLRKSIQVGTAPSHVDLFLAGTGQSLPSALYYDAQGNLRGMLSFDLGSPLATGEWIETRGQTRVMKLHRQNNAAITNAAQYLKEPYQFLVTDPSDGDGTEGPYLEALNCNLFAYVRKAYR